VLLMSLAVAACSSGGGAIVQTISNVVPRGASAAQAPLNPNFRYLRVTVDGRLALLALGYIEPASPAPIEVWYSAEREVLRFQSGRLVGATGLPAEWRNVKVPDLPAWSVLARHGEPLHWVRGRDVMPGYRYGITDNLTLRPIQAPARSALEGFDARQLTWFEETSQNEMNTPASHSGAVDKVMRLPHARYAVDLRGGKEEVVYGEQCLSADLCFTWQRWPAEGNPR